MTDKDMRKLGRAELLEMLIAQTQEVERLQTELDAAKAELEQRQILLNEAGNIADACLKINGVFESAQAAAEEYLVNIRLRHEKQDQMAQQMEQEARDKADKILSDAQAASKAMEEETAARCEQMVAKAQTESDARWKEVSAKVDAYLKQHSELRNLLFLDLLSNGEE